ncbi:MAG: hypothetical protein Q9191_004785 [Dirinaria sp. TL-2023a]
MQIQNLLILAATGTVLGLAPIPDNGTSVTNGVVYTPRDLPTTVPQASPGQGQNASLDAFVGALKEASNDDPKSAGDYYSAPTATGDGSASVPTDTSEVSASSNELPPVATGSMSRNGLENGAASIFSTSSALGTFLAALTAYFL